MSGNSHVRSRAGRRVRVALTLIGLVMVGLVPMAPANAATTISVSRGTVIGGESTTVSGSLGQRKARPVVLQRKSGTTWVKVLARKSTTAGRFTFSYKPPTRSGSKTVIRVIAPKVRISGKSYAQITTSSRTVLTVGQSATIAVPSVVSQGSDFTITGRFTPARTGRIVGLQQLEDGIWVGVTTTSQSSTGVVSFPMHADAVGTFQYRVITLAAGGAPAVPSAAAFISVLMPVPTGLTATPGTGSVQLSWNAVVATELAGYRVYQRTDPSDLPAGWTQIPDLISGTSFNVTGLTPGVKYYFTVTSVRNNGDESAFASKTNATPVAPPDNTAPPVPNGVVATPKNAAAQVSWTAVADVDGDLAGYNVYQGASASGPWTKLNGGPISGTTYPASGLTNGTQYFFAVTSVDTKTPTANESAKSTAASATPAVGADTTAPPVPGGLNAASGNASAQVTWSAVADVDGDLAGYNVYQGPNASGPWTKLNGSPISATAYLANGLTNGTQYFFAVTSVDTNTPTANESAKSQVVSTTPTAPPTGWTAVSSGLQHTCALGSNGTLWCWGLNRHGQLGNSTGTETGNAFPTPTRVGSATNWTSVSAGDDFTCGIQAPGTLWCWGRNKYGQVGSATNADTELPNATPIQVGVATTWTSVSAGGNSACGVQSNGTVWCWGLNLDGEIGRAANADTTTPNPTPGQVGAATTWASVSTGADHACARRTDSTVWCWGSNLYGQLGNATNAGVAASNPTPTQVAGTTWTSVASGDYGSCGVQSGGSIRCWGRNDYGQLASAVDAADGAHPTPATVTGTGWSQVSVGGGQVCATKTDGTAWCWGRRNLGQAGSTGATPLTTPTKVGVATNWAFVDAGTGHDLAEAGHTAGLTTASTVLTWGSNFTGQLGRSGGDPTTVGTMNPNPTPGLVPVPAG